MQDDEEDESELPSLDSLMGLDSTRPHSNSEDALNQMSLTKSALPTQGSAEVLTRWSPYFAGAVRP